MVEVRLGAVRKSRGIRASDLARRAGVSRQTIYAIEAGTYVPNTHVALQLARELEVDVGDLFLLAADSPVRPRSRAAHVLSDGATHSGQLVRMCEVESRWVGVPVSAAPYYMPEADGVVKRTGKKNARTDVTMLEETSQRRLVLAGCDPAAGLLSNMAARSGGVEIVPAAASSKLALRWLKEGKAHIAGSHLEDPKTGEFNVSYIRQEFSNEALIVVTFAEWEEGFVVAPANPRSIRRPEDLARRGVRFVNREPGSGSRIFLDALLTNAGVPAGRVQGYERIAPGHLAAAYAVASSAADVCLATRSAARAFGLEFVPLRSARYDFAMRKRTADLPAVQQLLDLLQRASLRRKLEALAGYETSRTGAVVAWQSEGKRIPGAGPPD